MATSVHRRRGGHHRPAIRDQLAGTGRNRTRQHAAGLRKDAGAKRELLADVDLTMLCLPDEAAKEAARLIDDLGDRAPRVLDASTAHRVAPGWVYGFPELTEGQAEPHPRGAQRDQSRLLRDRRDRAPAPAGRGRIAAARLSASSIDAVSGYSGGGKSMIEAYESGQAPAFELYAPRPRTQALAGDLRRIRA